ncbi:MAG: hypothetical protein CMB80_25605 [Flammeovirgaceae bacterium]|nr:hypothetical protein [Flammeovirgaceae bacterium]
MDKNMEEKEAQAKLGQGVMQALIKVSALEKALLQKGLLTETELAEALAFVVSDVAKTAKEELGVVIEVEQDSD